MLSFNEFGLLPEGIHKAELNGFGKFFGFNAKRKEMIDRGLKPFLLELRSFHLKEIYLDGSFVTMNENPDDIDGYIVTGIEHKLHSYIVGNQERWLLNYRMDIYAAMTDVQGESSKEWWEEWFSTAPNLPAKKKGYIALKMMDKGDD